MISRAILRPIFLLILSICMILLCFISSGYLMNGYEFRLWESQIFSPTTTYKISRIQSFEKSIKEDQEGEFGTSKTIDPTKSDHALSKISSKNSASRISNEFARNPPKQLKMCPENPPNLAGPIEVSLDAESMENIEALFPSLEAGGHGKPENCIARHKVAIVIPFRDRNSHLKIFLKNIHSMLQKQQLDYRIFVVEQVKKQTFNRGKLMNVGYREASKLFNSDCFVFHDVDLLPEDDRNLYRCTSNQPVHLSVAMDKFYYNPIYPEYFGGACMLTKKLIDKMNGFSNDFWGWGGEDDDAFKRVSSLGYKLFKNEVEIGRYTMIKHTQDSGNPINECRFKLLNLTPKRWKKDGLNKLNYKIIDISSNRLFTRIKVDLLQKESLKLLRKEKVC